MKKAICGIFTVRFKPIGFFSQESEKRFEEYVGRCKDAEMEIFKNGKAIIKLFNRGFFPHGEFYDPTVELFLEKTKEGKTKASLAYRTGDVFNGYFVEGEKSQFSLLTLSGTVRFGLLETLSVKNSISEDGGKVVLKFKATYSGLVNSLVVMELKVCDSLEDEKDKKIYS